MALCDTVGMTRRARTLGAGRRPTDSRPRYDPFYALLAPCDDEQVERLRRLLSMVMVEDAGLAWLERPNPMLDGETPVSRLKQGRAKDVEALLLSLAEGVVA